MLSVREAGVAFDFAALRAREFSRLDQQGLAYLDYTGSALYGASQIREHAALLERGIFGNPHSESAPSRASTLVIEEMKDLVLAHFGVDRTTHDVCFTANTSAAIRLVAESFPFGPGSPLLLTADNHNSVNGIREFARRSGAPVQVIPIDGSPAGAMRLVHAEEVMRSSATRGGLFAFPAQSNFSGVLHPLRLVDEARRSGYRVLLDAAAYVPTHALDLRSCGADFVVLSFYKMFGYPTGLGALVARRESLGILRRPWFAGGTVEYASVAADLYRLREGSGGFEDGTPDFLSVAALPSGFEMTERAGMTAIQSHVDDLTSRLLSSLTALSHRGGNPVVRIYGPSRVEARGCTVAFNVLNRRGEVIPYQVVEARARLRNVALRGGCFCNPGAAEAAFGLDRVQLEEGFAEVGSDFTVERFSAAAGVTVGAVRASAGLANTEADVARLIGVIEEFSE